jgi:predicted PurR-regulated permease PerM
MNGDISGLDWGTIAAVYLALVLFGLGYNRLVAWLERRGYAHGFASLLVVAGVVVTVGMTAVISLTFALVTAGAFIASGTPMIIGSLGRYVTRREKQLQELREEARGGNAE